MYSYVLYYNIEKSSVNAVSAYLLFMIHVCTVCLCIGTDLMLAIDLVNKGITRKGNFKKFSHILLSDARFTRWRESRNLLSVWECSESSYIGWYGWFEADCECNGTTRYLQWSILKYMYTCIVIIGIISICFR